MQYNPISVCRLDQVANENKTQQTKKQTNKTKQNNDARINNGRGLNEMFQQELKKTTNSFAHHQQIRHKTISIKKIIFTRNKRK